MNEEIGESDLAHLLAVPIRAHLQTVVDDRLIYGNLSGVDRMISVYSICEIMGAKTVRDVTRLIGESKVPFCFMNAWMVESRGFVHKSEAEAIKKGYVDFISLIDDAQAKIDLNRAANFADGDYEPIIMSHPGAAAARKRNCSRGNL